MPSRAEAAALPRIRLVPATLARWTDLVGLFGPRGACAGCWCMYWRRERRRWEEGKGAGNRAALRRVVEQGPPPGMIAYAGRTPIGWCAVAPRADYPGLARSRVLAPVDDAPVWSISCLFVARPFRGRGLTPALVAAAAKLARRHGARAVEGYPVEPPGRQPDAFVWTGLASAFRRAGFVEVARRSPTRPIMRLAPAPVRRARGAARR
jgi:GNAT superfamily N-acetyltransferase